MKSRIVYIGVFFLILKTFLSSTTIYFYPDVLDNIMTVVVVVFLFACIIEYRCSVKKLFAFLLLGITSLISSYFCKEMMISTTVLTCIAVCNIDINKFLRFVYKCQKNILILHFIIWSFLAALNLVPLFEYYDNNTRLRFSMGFTHPNTLSIYVFNLLLLWIWFAYDKFSFKNYISYILIICINYILTDTRTSFLIGMLLIVIVFFSKLNKSNECFKIISMYIVPFITIFIMTVIWTYGSKLSYLLNRILNNRIFLGARIDFYYNITILGQVIEERENYDPVWGKLTTVFDCTYSSLMYCYGFIWLLLICIGFWKLAKIGNIKIHIMIIAWALYAVTEVHMLNGIKFFPILLLSILGNKYNKKSCCMLDHSFSFNVNNTFK